MEQKKQEPIRDARQLGTAKMLILGLQHMFAMFGATIVVPILVSGYFQKACGEPLTRGLSVSVTLFCAGFGTLIFHLCTKFKVPAFLGSSFAFLGGFYTVANLDSGMYADMAVNDKAAYACGGIFVAGMLYFVLALIIKLVGIKRVMRFLPPVVTGPIIICIGLSLAGSAINNASTNWVLAIIALGVIIIFNIWGKGLFKIIPILMGVIISYVVAFIMNAAGITNPDGSAILDFTSIASSAWVGIPKFQFMKFDITSILVMAPIAIATMMEHIGDMSAISATVERNFIADPGLHRTLIGDGIATAFAGAIGGPANTTYGENTGVLELSKVYDPRVIRIAAVFAIALSFIPKFSAVISTMPSAIIGGVSFMLYGMISAIGVRNVVENKVDLTKSRNLIIAGVIFVCGLGFGNGLTAYPKGQQLILVVIHKGGGAVGDQGLEFGNVFVYLTGSQRHHAEKHLIGLVIQHEHIPDVFGQVLLIGKIRHMEVMLLFGCLHDHLHPPGHLRGHGNPVFHPVDLFFKAQPVHVLRVIGVIIIGEKLRKVFKPLYQHPFPVHVGKALGPVDALAPQLPGIVLQGMVQGVGDFCIVNKVKVGKAKVVVPVLFVGAGVQYPCDPARQLPVLIGKKASGLAVFKGGVLILQQVVDLAGDHVGHITGMVFIKR